MPKIKQVSVVVLNYNGKKVLKNCLGSLLKQNYNNYELIVADNNSTDGSAEFIQKNFPKVKIVANKENIGIPGLNKGIEKAKGEYIITVGNDTKFDRNFIKEMVNVAGIDKKIGMVSPKIYYFDEKVDTLGLRVFKSGLTKDVKNEKDRDKIFCPSGCAELFRRDALGSLKPREYFDNDFFCYADDFDIGFRIILNGWKFAYAPKAVAYHMHGTTMSKNIDRSIYLGDRNRVWTIVKDFPTGFLVKNLHWILLLQLATIVKYALKGKFFLILKSKIDALGGFGKMLQKRKIIQRNKKISGKELDKLIKGVF